MPSPSGRSIAASHSKKLSVVVEELPVNEFGQMPSSIILSPRLPRRLPSKHLALIRQPTHAGSELGPVPLAVMILPPSPPESPSVFELNAQTAHYLAGQQRRAETPPYSDEDEDPLSECPMAPLAKLPRALSPISTSIFGPSSAAQAPQDVTLPRGSASGSIRRTSSPPTLEQITQRLRGTTHIGGHSVPTRRNSEPPVSPESLTTRLPTPKPVRAETLPSRLPTFLLDRARNQPVTPTRVCPGRPSSTLKASASPVPVRVGSAALSRSAPRMVIQEIPTFKLTPPPEREERALALRQRLARAAEERASATQRVERRHSMGSSLAEPLYRTTFGCEAGGLKVPGL